VKFIRYAERRIDQVGIGVLSYISNHSFLDNPTFRGMRSSLLNTFKKIRVLDLHGNAKKKEVALDGSPDVNVFDIQQGVAISLMLRDEKDKSAVFHKHLYGLREMKYRTLLQASFDSIGLTRISPSSPFYLFLPQDDALRSEYEKGWSVTKHYLLTYLAFKPIETILRLIWMSTGCESVSKTCGTPFIVMKL
jgi:hypothetical protein